MKLLVIDNYDSFTYNLVQYFGELGAEVIVKRNDQITVEEAQALRPDRICISPGPGRPENAGICPSLVAELGFEIPILGVCLGHQCIAQVFGAKISRATHLMHGKTSRISHADRGIFQGIEQPFEATRYHRSRNHLRSPRPRMTARSWVCNIGTCRCTVCNFIPNRS